MAAPRTVRCFLRNIQVAETPEERIRQNLLRFMVEKLDYPKSYIAVEKELDCLDKSSDFLPNRRIDILCFAKGVSPSDVLSPLLLVECKAVSITSKTLNQVAGYNYYIKAPYIALANQEGIRTGWYDNQKNSYIFINGLPKYFQLIHNIS